MDKLVIRVAEQNLSKIKELVKQGYDLNAPYNEHGFTPFTLAVAQKFQVSFINELIKLGGDVNQPIKDGRTPLMLSCLKKMPFVSSKVMVDLLSSPTIRSIMIKSSCICL